MLTVVGRKGLALSFAHLEPEKCLDDISLYGLENEALKTALKKPFIVTTALPISVEFEGKKYEFVIPAGYTWNGANVPAFAWSIIGQRTDPRFKLASCVHDYMCEHHEVIGDNRYLSTLIFETLCEYFGRFNDFKRWAMFHSVDNFQKVFGRDLRGRKWGQLCSI